MPCNPLPLEPGDTPSEGRRLESTSELRSAPALQQVATMLARARNAFERSEFAEATRLAEAAFDLAEDIDDPTAAAMLTLFEPVLARIFLHHLGSLSRAIYPIDVARLGELPLSPHTAFLLSRLERGICVRDVFDVVSLPRLEILRGLVGLVACGAVRLEERAARDDARTRAH